LRPEDFRNVFVVRDSDLTVHDEDEYYEKVTETLTGLRTSEIEKVLETLRHRGRLRTLLPDSPLANNADTDPPHVARLFDSARGLVDRMRNTATALRADGFDALVDEVQHLNERRELLEEERRRLVAGRDREQAHSAMAIVEEIKTLTGMLVETRGPEESDLRKWQGLDAERAQAGKTLAAERNRAGGVEERISVERSGLESDRSALVAARSRVDRIHASLRPQRESYDSDRVSFRKRTTQRAPLVVMAVLSGLATATGAVVFAMYAHVAGAVGAGAGAVLLVVALVQLWRLSSERRALDARAAQLCELAREHGIHVETALDIRGAIEETERELDVLADTVRGREARINALTSERDGARDTITRIERRMAAIDADIDALTKHTGQESIESLEAALRLRRETEATRRGRVSALESIIPATSGAPDVVAVAEAEIQARLEATAGFGAAPHDPERAGEVERELSRLRDQENRTAASRRGGQRELDDLRFAASETGVLDDVARCRTTVELEHLAGRLEQWCERIETEGNAARSAVTMFRDVEAEEREKVGTLFGPESPVSEVFSRVTDGRYTAVHFESESSRVMVETRDGLRLPATVLSGGAFDQLYLCVRLAIASRLLDDGRCFFLLDDPFIKADRERLGRLMDTLVGLAEDGWQFIYFTAKDEVVDALRPAIEAGRVALLSLEAPPVPRAARTRSTEPPSAPADNGQQRLEL
jgi:hypothetical protein